MSPRRPGISTARILTVLTLVALVALVVAALFVVTQFLLPILLGTRMEESDVPVVEGPETARLREVCEGTLVLGRGYQDSDEIEVVDLPSQQRSTIPLSESAIGISAPSLDGKIAYLTKGWAHWSLRVLEVATEEDTELIRWEMDFVTVWSVAPWRPCPVMHQSGELVAVQLPSREGDSFNPRFKTVILAVDSGELEPATTTDSKLGQRWGIGRELFRNVERGVEIFDLVDQSSRVLRGLHDAVPYHDGLRICARGPGGTLGCYSLDTGARLHELTLPGIFLDDVLGITTDGLLVYQGLPTAGQELVVHQGFVLGGCGPLFEWNIKVGTGLEGEFASLVWPVYHGRYTFSPFRLQALQEK